MKSLLTLTSALLLALALATPAFAEDGGGRKGKGKGRHGKGHIFHKFDKNKDGALTSDEVPARLWERLSKCDADGNGAVTKEEAKACKGKREGRRGGRKGGKKGGKEGSSTDA